MSSTGTVGYDNPGEDNQPSPIVWKDCPTTDLINDAGGYFDHVEFLDAGDFSRFGSALVLDADTTTLAAVTGKRGGWLSLATGSTDNDAAALVSQPFGRITRKTLKKVWMEAHLELAAVNDDKGVFIGLVEEAGADLDVVADDVGDLAVAGESLMGFLIDSNDGDAVDVIQRKDGDAVNLIAEDVTNSSAIDADDRGSLAADTPIKLGLRFDGSKTVFFYVDGVQVAKLEVDESVEQAKDLAAIVAVKTGSAASKAVKLDWVRYAYEERP